MLADPGPDDMFDDRVYKRGALTLHACGSTIGDEAFFALLRTWVTANKHGNVSTGDFVSLTEQVSGEMVTDLFAAWLHGLALPALPDPRR